MAKNKYSDYYKDYEYNVSEHNHSNNYAGIRMKKIPGQVDTFMENAEAIFAETVKKGSKLTEKELKQVIGASNYKAFRNDIYDTIYDDFYTKAIAPNLEGAAAQTTLGELDPLIQYFNQNKNSLGLSPDLQQLLDAKNDASQMQYSLAMQELNRAEQEMYRATGMAQRQMERDIAKRRQQALKSGMSTAQLAAQEQQNILAAQTGATQIAQQYADQRYNTINQFAGYSAQNMVDVMGMQAQYNQDWNNKLADSYAQIFAAKQMK